MSEPVLTNMSRAAGFDLVKVEASRSMIRASEAGGLSFHENDGETDHALFVNVVATLAANLDIGTEDLNFSGFMKHVDDFVSKADAAIEERLMVVLRQPRFREIERNWLMLSQIVGAIEGDNIQVDVLDVTKEELAEDIRDNSNHIMGSAMFQRMYVGEFDRFGGIPFSSMITLFEFDPSDVKQDGDLQFLTGLGRLAGHCHAPVVGAVAPQFFGIGSFDELSGLADLERVLERPKYGKWNAFRDTHEAAYVGLTMPRYLLREPHSLGDEARMRFAEVINKTDDYLWGNAAALFAQNMIRSFEISKWCQHVRGPEGGGRIRGLPAPVITGSDGVSEEQPAVDAAIPDYRELQLANAGFIALVSKKDQPDEACFFSAQSAKISKDFVEELATQNAHLVTNLSYTLSVSRVAHYIKCMARDYIGSSADAPYLQNMLQSWLSEYVTTITNPDDLTLTRYPFKAVTVEVTPKVGPLGWYKCTTSILPHIQFEGMDVELRLEAALGG
jgi:type VI secretion system protein ImpC